MTRRQLLAGLAAVLLVAWVAQALVLGFLGTIDQVGAAPFYPIMFVPALVGAVMLFRFRRNGLTVSWRPAGLGALAVSVLLPLALALVVLLLISKLGVARSGYFIFSDEGVQVLRGPWLLGSGLQSWWLFALNLIVTGAAYSLLAGLATIGEEFGWRGVFQAPAIRHFGLGWGVVLIGFAWGIFHVPMILAGYNFPETPVLGAFVLMPLATIAISYIFAWLTLWNGSFWPAVLMHGAINSVYASIIFEIAAPAGRLVTVHLINIGVLSVVALGAYYLARPYAVRARPIALDAGTAQGSGGPA